MPPIHPCALTVDRMRYPVREKMRFWSDSDQLVEVQWFFVPEDTPYVPHPGPFRSRLFAKPEEVNWIHGPVFPGNLGERYFDTRIRVLGLRPPLAPPDHGEAPCGSDSQWLDGSRIDLNLPLVPGLGGWPVCCDAVPLPPPIVPPPGCLFPKFIELDRDGTNPGNPYWTEHIWLCQQFPNHWVSIVRDYPGEGFVNWNMTLNAPFQADLLLLVRAEPPFDLMALYTISPVSPILSPYNFPLVWDKSLGLAQLPATVTVWPWLPFQVLATEDAVALATENGDVLTTEGEFLPPF